MAAAHAALVCAGYVPEYQAVPGFAPLAVSWGWLILGAVVGCMASLLVLACSGRLLRDPTVATMAALSETTPRGNAGATGAVQNESARQDALRYIATGGRPALGELASAAGMGEADFLAAVFGCRPGAANPLRPVAQHPWM